MLSPGRLGSQRIRRLISLMEGGEILPPETEISVQTVRATAVDAHTNTGVYEDIDSMELSISLDEVSDIVVIFTFNWEWVSANWELLRIRFALDSTYESNDVRVHNANPNQNHERMVTLHTVYENVAAGDYTLKAQWNDLGSGIDTNFNERRLTALIIA